MASTRIKIFNILLSAVVSTVLCQLGMALTCINPESVMHMPTAKNSVFVFVVALFISICIDVFFNYVIKYSRKTAMGIVILVLFLIMSVIVSFLNPIESFDGRIGYRYPMIAAILAGVLSYQLYLRKLKPALDCEIIKPDFTKQETVFSAIAIVFGIIICIVLPQRTMTCIDDETHYNDTLILSESIYTAYNEDDTDLIFGWDQSKNANSHVGALYVDANLLGFLPNKIGYISPTVGLWAGRILGLNNDGIYLCGRLSGLIIYVTIIYYAIRRLINGKLALGIICTSPIAIQYAVGYSYDAWLLAFTGLSMAYFFGARQRPNDKLSSKEIIIIIGSMFIGTLPKTPYAIMFLILLFMPRSKFTDSKCIRNYYLLIGICVVLELGLTIATSFGLGDVADTRGGENISAYGQMEYILNNCETFAKTLAVWIKNFLMPLDSWDYLTRFGFYQNSEMFLALIIAICISALIDNKILVVDNVTRFLGLIILFALIVVIGILMYLSFTPVGVNYIQGAQTRYKLQLLFPFVMFLLSGHFVPKQKYKNICSALAYSVSSFCLIMTIVSIV